MDALKKWMVIWFTPHKTTTLPKFKMDDLHKNLLQIILAAKWLVNPPTSSDDLSLLLPSVILFRSRYTVYSMYVETLAKIII